MAGNREQTRRNIAEIQPLLDEVVRVVCDHLNAEFLRLYLFGSWAEGRALSVSDLDIALDTGGPIELAMMQRISDALDELPTLRRVDVVDLHAVDRKFRNQVVQRGVFLSYSGGPASLKPRPSVDREHPR